MREEAAKRACAKGIQTGGSHLQHMLHSFAKKIFKWHERGDKTRDGRAAPLLGTNSNVYGVSRGPNGAAAFCSTFSKQLLWRTVAETITYIAHM